MRSKINKIVMKGSIYSNLYNQEIKVIKLSLKSVLDIGL
jgi:hypothetical protein